MIDVLKRYPDLPGTEGLPTVPRELFEIKRRRCQESGEEPARASNCEPTYTNRLFLESSPYLLQHAHNPVNWFPWGSQAFEQAEKLKRPVLVSIGYSTCHWCHVMERESFEDEEVALFLNRHFVAIKVDREERPDLDSFFMAALQSMGTQGGWPLNIFVTPEGKPFYGGTYFPIKSDRGGIGFLSLLQQLYQAYHRAPDEVQRVGAQLTEAVRSLFTTSSSGQLPEAKVIEEAIASFRRNFDSTFGGLLGAPKFPGSLPIRLLLRYYLRSGDVDVLAMVDLTLKQMAQGGIYDQIGGGFHRYATDHRWQIPHFEKMLYDNAQLAVTYLEGSQALGRVEFLKVGVEILDYLVREMKSPEEGFFSATDADSLSDRGSMEEGVFFTWSSVELAEHLEPTSLHLVKALFEVTESGNFEGRNILHREKPLAEVARHQGLAETEAESLLKEAASILYQARRRRPLPITDRKILAGWNGLALSAFARAALLSSNALEQAIATGKFLTRNLMKHDRLAHSWQEGEAKGEGFLDDYAMVIAGLIDLFEVTGQRWWLDEAITLTGTVQRDFVDGEAGGYFLTGIRHEKLLAKEKPGYDGVIPSGNSVMIMNLLRLFGLTEKPTYQEEAERALQAFSAQLSSMPAAHCEMLLALDFFSAAQRQLAVVAPRGKRNAAEPLLGVLRKTFFPNRVLAVVCEGEELDTAGEIVPFLRGKKADGDRAVAYLCENRTCRMPTSDPAALDRQLHHSSDFLRE